MNEERSQWMTQGLSRISCRSFSADDALSFTFPQARRDAAVWIGSRLRRTRDCGQQATHLNAACSATAKPRPQSHGLRHVLASLAPPTSSMLCAADGLAVSNRQSVSDAGLRCRVNCGLEKPNGSTTHSGICGYRIFEAQGIFLP
jgi:hypothetical protein